MKRDNGITMADYEILVRLSEAPERSLRMSELAEVDAVLAVAPLPPDRTHGVTPAG